MTPLRLCDGRLYDGSCVTRGCVDSAGVRRVVVCPEVWVTCDCVTGDVIESAL